MRKTYILLVGLLLVGGLAACGGVAQTPETPVNTPAPSQTATPAPAHTTAAVISTPLPSETTLPAETSPPAFTPTPTPPTFVRENKPLPMPDEPITAGNASRMVELARLGKGAIRDVQLSPNRVFLLVRTTIGVYGYNADRLEEAWRFEDPTGIAAMAVPRLERWIAVAMNDGRIALLIYQRGSMFTQWVSGYREIKELTFSYDGKLLAAVGDRGVTVWQVGETEPLVEYPALVGSSVRFTPDGESLIVADENQLAFYGLTTGAELEKIFTYGYGLPVFSQDGQVFSDGSFVWDGETGEVVLDLDFTPEMVRQPAIAFSRDSRFIAVGQVGTLEVFIWDITQKVQYQHLVSPAHNTGLADPWKVASPAQNIELNFIQSLAFSPDGNELAVETNLGEVELWDTGSGRFKTYLERNGTPLYLNNDRMFLWNTQLIFQFFNERRIELHRTDDFSAYGRLNFSMDGQWLFVDNAAWDLDELRKERLFQKETVISVSLDGKFFYTISYFPLTVTKRSTVDFTEIEQIQLSSPENEWCEESYWTEYVIISSTGSHFGAYNSDCGFMLWDLSRNKIIDYKSDFWDFEERFSPDGSLLAANNREGTKIYRLDELETGEPSIILDAYVLAFSPSNDWVFAVLPPRLISITSEIGIGKAVEIKPESEFELDITHSEFSPVGSVLLASGFKTIFLLSSETGELLTSLPAHLDQIVSIAFSSDGKYLATSSYDGTVKLWGVPAGE